MLMEHWSWIVGALLLLIAKGTVRIIVEIALRRTKEMIAAGTRKGNCTIDYRADGSFFITGDVQDVAQIFDHLRPAPSVEPPAEPVR